MYYRRNEALFVERTRAGYVCSMNHYGVCNGIHKSRTGSRWSMIFMAHCRPQWSSGDRASDDRVAGRGKYE